MLAIINAGGIDVLAKHLGPPGDQAEVTREQTKHCVEVIGNLSSAAANIVREHVLEISERIFQNPRENSFLDRRPEPGSSFIRTPKRSRPSDSYPLRWNNLQPYYPRQEKLASSLCRWRT